MQAPFRHTSPCVHAFPSEHAVPFGCETETQRPVLCSQVPPVKQAPVAVHDFGAPEQVPAKQASLIVQRLSSLHAVPAGAFGFEQSPVLGLQVPATWH